MRVICKYAEFMYIYNVLVVLSRGGGKTLFSDHLLFTAHFVGLESITVAKNAIASVGVPTSQLVF